MGYDVNLYARYVMEDVMKEFESSFPQVNEMDKLLGLASEDALKESLTKLLLKYAAVFGTAIEYKGDNTRTTASIKNFMKMYCKYMTQNILANYKDADETKLIGLFEHVTPFASKIIIELEKEPKPSAMLYDMLEKCIGRFAKEYGM